MGNYRIILKHGKFRIIQVDLYESSDYEGHLYLCSNNRCGAYVRASRDHLDERLRFETEDDAQEYLEANFKPEYLHDSNPSIEFMKKDA